MHLLDLLSIYASRAAPSKLQGTFLPERLFRRGRLRRGGGEGTVAPALAVDLGAAVDTHPLPPSYPF